MTPSEEIEHLADVPVKLEIELDQKLTRLEEVMAWEPGPTRTKVAAKMRKPGMIRAILFPSGRP